MMVPYNSQSGILWSTFHNLWRCGYYAGIISNTIDWKILLIWIIWWSRPTTKFLTHKTSFTTNTKAEERYLCKKKPSVKNWCWLTWFSQVMALLRYLNPRHGLPYLKGLLLLSVLSQAIARANWEVQEVANIKEGSVGPTRGSVKQR